MTSEEFKNWAEAASAIVTAIGILIGGGWAFRKYIWGKEDIPRIHMAVDANFVGMHQNVWVVELLCLLENKGAVHHAINKLDFELRRLSATDAIEEKESKVGGQLLFQKVHKEGSWTPSDSTETMLILPSIALRYSYICHVPTTVRFLLLHGKLEYVPHRGRGIRRGKGISYLRADRVFRVPEDAGGCPDSAGKLMRETLKAWLTRTSAGGVVTMHYQ